MQPHQIASSFGPAFAKTNAVYEHQGGAIVTKAYLDPNAVPTGPGGMIYNLNGTPVKEGQTWTEEEALEMYARGRQRYADELLDHVIPQLTQLQLDGLGILFWNIGAQNFAGNGGSTVLRRLNAHDFPGAAAAFGMWSGDTFIGGRNGPDGKPVRDPYGNIMPRGKRWFKRYRGLYRRNSSGACIFSGYDPVPACDLNRIEFVTETVENYRGYDWYDRVVRKTEWAEILSVARNHPISEAYFVPPTPVEEERPEPEPAPTIEQPAASTTKPPVKEKKTVKQPVIIDRGPMPPSLPSSPTGYGKIDPQAQPKEWYESRREWGRIIQLLALANPFHALTNSQALAMAEIGGLAVAITVGYIITKWGQRGATRYTK